jgi:hypothetical protein
MLHQLVIAFALINNFSSVNFCVFRSFNCRFQDYSPCPPMGALTPNRRA